jgi:hypothetical protein
MDSRELPSPTRLIAHGVGVLTVAFFILGVLNNWGITGGGTAALVILYVALRVLRPLLDPLIVTLLIKKA